MDSGTIGLEDLQRSINDARKPVWVQAVLGPTNRRRAPLYNAIVCVGPQPAYWRPVNWRYESCTFMAVRTTTKQLAAGLRTRELSLGVLDAELDLGPVDTWQWRREPSYSRLDRFRTPWPSVNYELALAGRANQQLPERLVGRDAPSFPTLGSAFEAFVYGNFEPSGTMNPTLGRISLRVVDTSGRLRRIAARPGAVDVFLSGTRLKGTVLELNSPAVQRCKRLQGAGKISWPLPPGSLDMWLWLKRGGDWIDFRAPARWGGYVPPQDSLTEMAPDDPVAEVTAFASQGEGQQMEYKSSMPPPGGARSRNEKNVLRTALKDIVAFANTGGGTVLYGVTDDGDIIGVEGPLGKARDRLSEFVRHRVSPTLPHTISPKQIDGALVLVLEVRPEPRTLYSLMIEANSPEFFIRRNGTSYPARPDELAAIFA